MQFALMGILEAGGDVFPSDNDGVTLDCEGGWGVNKNGEAVRWVSFANDRCYNWYYYN